MHKRDIKQQEEERGLNRRTLKHLGIPNVSISMVIIISMNNFFDTRRLCKHSHLSDSNVEDTILSKEFAMIFVNN